MPQPLVLLVLPQALDPVAGGVQRSTWQMGHQLAEHGWRVAFASMAPDGHREPSAGVLHRPDSDLSSSGTAIRDFFASVIARENPQIVINQVGVAEEPARSIAELNGISGDYRVISCFRNTPAFFKNNHELILKKRLRPELIAHGLALVPYYGKILLAWHRYKNRPTFRLALSRCDRMMLLAPTYLDELRWYVPELETGKILVIPNGYQVPETTPPASKENIILFVGRLEDTQKNVMMLPRIWEKLCMDIPEWEFHIVGDGPAREKLLAEFQSRSLPRYHMHGKSDPRELFGKSSIFLMTSSYEGFANTLIESQLHGTVPVVYDSFSAVRYMANDGKDAVIVPAFDETKFVQGVRRLATNKEKRACYSIAARENALRFSEERVFSLWESALRNLMPAGR